MTQTKHRKINGICYIYKVNETYEGRCEEHSPKEINTNTKDTKRMIGGKQ